MRDVGERPAMHEGGIVLQRLHQIGLHRVLQQHRHRTIGLDVAGIDRFAIAGISHDHITQTFLQILQVTGQTQAGHDFGCNGDIEPGLTGKTVADPAQAGGDLAQGPVVHIDDAPPDDASDVDLQRVAPVDVIVDHRRQQGMRTGDGMEIAGEVEVHLLHRNDLRVTAARSAALHPEIGPERGFADADHRLFADRVQTVAQTHRRRRLAFTRGCRVDRGHKDKFAVLTRLGAVDERLTDLGLVMPIRQQIIHPDAQLLSDLQDRTLIRRTGNLDICLHGHGGILFVARASDLAQALCGATGVGCCENRHSDTFPRRRKDLTDRIGNCGYGWETEASARAGKMIVPNQGTETSC